MKRAGNSTAAQCWTNRGTNPTCCYAISPSAEQHLEGTHEGRSCEGSRKGPLKIVFTSTGHPCQALNNVIMQCVSTESYA